MERGKRRVQENDENRSAMKRKEEQQHDNESTLEAYVN